MHSWQLVRPVVWLLVPFGFIGGGFFLGRLYFLKSFAGEPVTRNPAKKIKETSFNDEELLKIEETQSLEHFVETIPQETEDVTDVNVVEPIPIKPAVFEEPEIIEEETPAINPLMDYVVLYEGETKFGVLPNENQDVYKCKLFNDEQAHWCSFHYIEKDPLNKFITFSALKNGGISAFLEKNFFDTPKKLYKARVPKLLFDKWVKDKNQNLEVYKQTLDKSKPHDKASEATFISDEKPTITLKPTFGYHTTNNFFGKTQYYAAYSTDFLEASDNNSDAKSLDLTSKWFNCALPEQKDKVHKCYIYKLDDDPNRTQGVTVKQLQVPISKAEKVDKNQFYLIKFLEPQDIKMNQYNQKSDVLKVDVYLDQARQTHSEEGIKTINFSYVSALIMHHEEWDIGAAIIL